MQTGISLSMRQILGAALRDDWKDSTTGATLELFQNNFTPSPLSLVADFTECDFVGYSRKTGIADFVTFNDAPTGDQVVSSLIVQLFAATSIVSAQTAYGWLLVDAARTELLAWGLLDTPYQFNASGDKLEVVPAVRLLLNTGQSG